MTVTDLFIKRAHGSPMQPVRALHFGPGGIANGIHCSPLRQVLITSRAVSREFALAPGDLRENIVVDFDGLYDLPSGTVLRIGDALVRLTFHCEPCRKILHLVDYDRILHKRGYLGCFLNSGMIAVGDACAPTEQTLEAIPYAVAERVRWFFAREQRSLAAVELAQALGLPSSYTRVIPRLIEKLAATRR